MCPIGVFVRRAGEHWQERWDGAVDPLGTSVYTVTMGL